MGLPAPKFERRNHLEVVHFRTNRIKVYKLVSTFILLILIGFLIMPSMDTPPKEHPKVDLDDGVDWANDVPCGPEELMEKGYKEIPKPKDQLNDRRWFEKVVDGIVITVAFDKKHANGDGAKPHWHRYNPYKTTKSTRYLDRYNYPRAGKKKDCPSHIYTEC